MEMHSHWQRGSVPTAGIKVDLMAVRHQPARQVGDVGLAAAACRQNTLVAESDVHVGCLSLVGPRGTSLPEALSFGIVALVATPSNQDHPAEPTIGDGPRKTGQAAVLSFFLFPAIGSPKPPAIAACDAGDVGRIEQLRQVLHLPPAPGPRMMPQP